jgi:hypothetical protein
MSLQGLRCAVPTAELKSFGVISTWKSPNHYLRPFATISGGPAALVQIRYASCWGPDPQGAFDGATNRTDSDSSVGLHTGYRHEYDDKLIGIIKTSIGGFEYRTNVTRVELGFFSCVNGCWCFKKYIRLAHLQNSMWGVKDVHDRNLLPEAPPFSKISGNINVTGPK